MSIILYSAAGCKRCAMVRQLLNERSLSYQDHDALGKGREAFRTFYQKNRKNIFRGPDGIEFPIFHEGKNILQGLPMVAAHLFAGARLKGFFTYGRRHGQWIDGICVSGGNPDHGPDFIKVLNYLQGQGFKIQIETNGVNPGLLETVYEYNLADYVIMDVKGSLELYKSILHQPVNPAEIERSIAIVAKFNDYTFVTNIAPIVRQEGDPAQISYITPQEVAEAANLIKTICGDAIQPYQLRYFDPKSAEDERLRTCKALTQAALLKYRTLARKHQFKTEIVT